MGFVAPVQEGMISELGVKLDGRGNVAADTVQYKSTVEKVFACGDATSIRSDLPPGSELVLNPAEADFYIGMTAVPCDGYTKPGAIIAEIKRMGVVIGYVRDLRTP